MTISIPFKVLSLDGEGYHLMLKIYLNRKVANVIIDTGASKTVLDKTMVKNYVTEQNFDVHDKLSSGLGTNTMESQITVIKKLKIGALEMNDYQTILLDLSHVNSSYQQIGLKPVVGVLGSDILLKYKAVIDYEKQLLKLKVPKKQKK